MFSESDVRKEYFFNEPVFDELNFMNFGYEKCLPEHSFGPQIRDYFILHFILSGKGTFENNNRFYHLQEGTCFLIEPSDSHAIYQADRLFPWTYVWIGFEGTRVNEILEQLGFISDVRVGKIRNKSSLIHDLQPFISGDFMKKTNPLLIQGNFIKLFGRLALNMEENVSQIKNNNQQKYVDAFVRYVRNNYSRPDLTIEEIAGSIGLHPTYLTQLVREELKQTSIDYLITYRLIKARLLLVNTEMTVEAVAESVGYRNVVSFSRAFKKNFGYSPKRYSDLIRRKADKNVSDSKTKKIFRIPDAPD